MSYFQPSICDFDFHYVEIITTRKRDLLKAGIKETSIESRTEWFSYRGFRRSRRYYKAMVDFFHVNTRYEKSPDDVAKEWEGRVPGARVKVGYHCAD